jgi:hypothetical protein
MRLSEIEGDLNYNVWHKVLSLSFSSLTQKAGYGIDPGFSRDEYFLLFLRDQ